MLQSLPLVSVIIPIYDVEPYLRECVDSVIGQTYTNLEIILVDDGSPDNCPKICDEYAHHDSRVKVIHKSNGGLSDARNAGMKIATADYWTFVDSDDVCHVRMIEVLMKPMLDDKEIDLSCGDYDNSFPNTIIWKNTSDDYQVYNAVSYLTKRWSATACMKIYRKELFINELFPVGRLIEDFATTYRIEYKAHKIACTDSEIYFYRKRTGSIMNTPSREKIWGGYAASIESAKFFEDKEPEIYSKFLINAAKHYYQACTQGSVYYYEGCDDILAEWKDKMKGFPIAKLGIPAKIRYIFFMRYTKIAGLCWQIWQKIKKRFPSLIRVKKKLERKF